MRHAVGGRMKVLVVDVGGSSVKMRLSGSREVRRFSSGPKLTALQMAAGVKRAAKGWRYDAVSIGYPGPVRRGRVLAEPKNLGAGWMRVDFRRAFGRPVVLLNDAAMQALGCYTGGRMLFLGLGTGLGSTVISDHAVLPMELGHLPYKKKQTFEDYVGHRGLKRLGKAKWRRAVVDVVARLKDALVADYVVLGGGNAKRLKPLPQGARLGHNAYAFVGGERVWDGRWREDIAPEPPMRSGKRRVAKRTP
jgi:polyphosphate glucokinase